MAAKTKAPSSCGVDHATLRRLQVGVYEDTHGRSLHLCLDEICEAAGYDPTPENLNTAECALRELLAEQWPGVPITVAGREQRAPGEPVH